MRLPQQEPLQSSQAEIIEQAERRLRHDSHHWRYLVALDWRAEIIEQAERRLRLASLLRRLRPVVQRPKSLNKPKGD